MNADEASRSTPLSPGGGENSGAGGEFRCGFAAILGKPNAGKSTLLNTVAGQKIAIVSPKPQTTRDRIHGVYSDERVQIIFMDLPGLVEARARLHLALLESIRQGIEGVDAALHLIDVTDTQPLEPPVPELLAALAVPVIAVINKVDLLPRPFDLRERLARRPGWIDPSRYHAILTISAQTGDGVPALVETLLPLMPEGPPHFDPDTPTDRDLRWLAGEIVREQVFLALGEEIPYSVATETERFEEREEGKWFLRIVIYVERESQKGIVIGAGGERLREIGRAARKGIEELTGQSIFLELWVKVRKNWTKNEADLRRFGYSSAESRATRGHAEKRRRERRSRK